MFSLIIRRTWSNEICAPVLVSLNEKMTQILKSTVCNSLFFAFGIMKVLQ